MTVNTILVPNIFYQYNFMLTYYTVQMMPKHIIYIFYFEIFIFQMTYIIYITSCLYFCESIMCRFTLLIIVGTSYARN